MTWGGHRKPVIREYFWRTVGTQTDECMIWPHAKDLGGYGVSAIFRAGRPVRIHVAALTAHNGARPDGLDCAHLCGNPACYNHRHLVWATRSQNQLHRRAHGTSAKGTKFPNRKRLPQVTVDRVIIDIIEGKKTFTAIAEQHGCSLPLVSKIAAQKIHGQSWARMAEIRGQAA